MCDSRIMYTRVIENVYKRDQHVHNNFSQVSDRYCYVLENNPT